MVTFDPGHLHLLIQVQLIQTYQKRDLQRPLLAGWTMCMVTRDIKEEVSSLLLSLHIFLLSSSFAFPSLLTPFPPFPALLLSLFFVLRFFLFLHPLVFFLLELLFLVLLLLLLSPLQKTTLSTLLLRPTTLSLNSTGTLQYLTSGSTHTRTHTLTFYITH